MNSAAVSVRRFLTEKQWEGFEMLSVFCLGIIGNFVKKCAFTSLIAPVSIICPVAGIEGVYL